VDYSVAEKKPHHSKISYI